MMGYCSQDKSGFIYTRLLKEGQGLLINTQCSHNKNSDYDGNLLAKLSNLHRKSVSDMSIRMIVVR